ncbi:SlyX family protein [uncultured Treponema sp.]|uniref:SlyX family protein n=1 Tax=uncultured Treponema sp. TaxID=162155 RepID=UPI002600C236|nr:SlyX family protein [uncultured Treponema sp.]
MTESEVEEKFIALETKIAYMDDFISKLQEETVENQKTIQILREENQILAGRIQDLQDNQEIPNRRPPHY